ncbi:hypothetical protein K457DRAFT_744426 [Linnemannia elongata AG-77]|uniref:Uncharacterized protein n=1 Tax=Linnemannia elongata AG-77 TaxID=1314771 RepID=A0A197JKN3_9FUNG|nr:hypothetical protein K457DRAFT_744426 [Linnemannia elongata AG-77]
MRASVVPEGMCEGRVLFSLELVFRRCKKIGGSSWGLGIIFVELPWSGYCLVLLRGYFFVYAVCIIKRGKMGRE